LTRDELSKVDRDGYVITKVDGKRTIVLEPRGQGVLAFSAVCTHEGCTVSFLPDESIIWCACHNGRYDLQGRVVSGPPPRPLPEYGVQKEPDGGIVVSISGLRTS